MTSNKTKIQSYWKYLYNKKENQKKNTLKDSIKSISPYENQISNIIKIGFEQGSFFASMIKPLKEAGLSSEMLTNIIITKMNLEYQQEIARMKLETDEKIMLMTSEFIDNNQNNEE